MSRGGYPSGRSVTANPLVLEVRQKRRIDGENEERIGVVHAGRMVRVHDMADEIVVVGHEQRVPERAAHVDVGAEGEAFELGRNVLGRDAMRAQRRHDVEEQRLADRGAGQIGFAGEAADVLSAVEVDVEELLERGDRVVAEALAIALVDQEFVIVDRDDFADGRILGLDAVPMLVSG